MLKNRPPKLGQWLLKRFLLADECHEKLGDFEEGYHIKAIEKGKHKAFVWYWLQLIMTIPVFVKNLVYWRIIMFKNHIKIILRNIKKHKGFSFINIFGLAVGIASSILVLVYVFDELSYDRFHVNADRTYRIISDGLFVDYPIHMIYTPTILAETLRNEFVDNIIVTQFGRYPGIVNISDKNFINERILAADNSFFDVFSFSVIRGDLSNALDEPFTVVLTYTAALKYFGKTDVLGNRIRIGDNDFLVSGIIQDVPQNSHFTFDTVVSIRSLSYYQIPQWMTNNWSTYVTLGSKISCHNLKQRLDDLAEEHINSRRRKTHENDWWKYNVEPLLDIHLKSDLNAPYGVNGRFEYVVIFSIVAFLILIIACVNYVNLATARSFNRAKEVGIRKLVGSFKGQLIKQFLTESILLCLISSLLALILVKILLPFLSDIAGRRLDIHYFNNPIILPGIFLLIILLGLFSGIYPAFFLSSFNPVSVLKGSLRSKKQKSILRKGLVVFQYTISIFLLISTIVIYSQLKYFQNINLGFNKEQVLIVRNANLLGEQKNSFKEELLTYANIENVTGSSSLPGRALINWSIKIEGNDDELTLNFCICDNRFLETMNIELLKGRFFSKEIASDQNAIVINKEAAKMFGGEDPIGKKIIRWSRTFIVIGIVKNFHYESLHSKIDKMCMVLPAFDLRNYERYISAKVNTNNLSDTMKFVRETWEKFVPKMKFEYSFLDEDLNRLYLSEERTKTLSIIFSFLAIFISSLGMFGLASFSAGKRTKEIGIRKVLGATAAGLTYNFSKEFITKVLVANVIAWPIAYSLMQKWLEDFAYRIDIGIGTFILSGLMAFAIALLTISYQIIKAATANPVDSLRYE